MDPNYKIITIDEESVNTRLDKFLSDFLREEYVSREKIKKNILLGNILINDEIEKSPRRKLLVNDVITLKPFENKDDNTTIEPKNINLDIIYEDDDVMVINKQAGLTTHPGAGNIDNTLVNALLYHNKDNLSEIGGSQRPGIVHRLDKDTSGLIMVAKNDAAHLSLSSQLQDRSLTREYRAIIWGMIKPEEGRIENNIDRSTKNRKIMEVTFSRGKKAITDYQTEEIFIKGMLSLVKCNLKTGRTHQIRVHMSDKGNSIFGDPSYGNHTRKLKKLFDSQKDQILFDFKRQALHAYKICFIHPSTKRKMEFKVDMPEDITNLIEFLRAKS